MDRQLWPYKKPFNQTAITQLPSQATKPLTNRKLMGSKDNYSLWIDDLIATRQTTGRLFFHIKVAKWGQSHTPWHILPVYKPSGASAKQPQIRRSRAIGALLKRCRKLLHKESNAKIIALGDFNYPRDKMEKILTTKDYGMMLLDCTGTTLTRHSNHQKWNALDYMLVSKEARKALGNYHVDRDQGTNSDHWPITARLRHMSDQRQDSRDCWNIKTVQGNANPFFTSTLWDPLHDPKTIEELEQDSQDLITNNK